jgi:hypothetical protein
MDEERLTWRGAQFSRICRDIGVRTAIELNGALSYAWQTVKRREAPTTNASC